MQHIPKTNSKASLNDSFPLQPYQNLPANPCALNFPNLANIKWQNIDLINYESIALFLMKFKTKKGYMLPEQIIHNMFQVDKASAIAISMFSEWLNVSESTSPADMESAFKKCSEIAAGIAVQVEAGEQKRNALNQVAAQDKLGAMKSFSVVNQTSPAKPSSGFLRNTPNG
jgi:hypothetical protein